MKAYTTIEESKQLIEAGLDVNTADMFYTSLGNYNTPWVWNNKPLLHIKDIPCWSSTALLETIKQQLPDDYYLGIDSNTGDNDTWQIVLYSYEEGSVKGFESIAFTKAVYDLMLWLLKNNYIKK